MNLLKNPSEYITCFEVWIQFVAKYFSTKEVDSLLGDFLYRMIKNEEQITYSVELQNIMDKIITNISDIESFLVMDHFFAVMDLFEDKSRLIEVSKVILCKYNATVHQTDDPVVTNVLMYLASNLHDSINMLTPEDEKRQISQILCKTIRIVNYGLDFDLQLDLYVEARHAFCILDTVIAELVKCVNNLAVSVRQVVKGYHTRKTADFVRACAAYCFITIPSINCTRTRLKLYLFSGQIALYNSCLGQADACFKAILSTISELPCSTDTDLFLPAFVRQFLSLLMVVPDNPERGVLSLIKSLLNTIRNFKWQTSSSVLGFFYVHVIDLLSVMAQEVYPYHVDKVESNDSLWGSDPKFIDEINNMIAVVIGEILFLLQDLGPCQKQYQIAMELFVRFAVRADLRVKELNGLALKLWNLCIKSNYPDIKYMATTKTYLKNKSLTCDNEELQRLAEKMSLLQK